MPTRFNTPVSPRGDAPLARMLRHTPPYVALILLAVVTGLVTGTAAFILKTTVRWVSHPIASHLAAGHANWLLLVAPLIGIILAVSSYVSAFATLARDLAGQEDLEFGPDAMRELGEVITPERLPFAAPLFLSGGYVGGPVTDETQGVEFEYSFGLDLLIEGLAARHAPRERD